MNVVVVNFNYRVGPYGFLASKEVQENGDLNVGLKDQRQVFEWVQKYIREVTLLDPHSHLADVDSVAVRWRSFSCYNWG
jgi:Carboxylesterase family